MPKKLSRALVWMSGADKVKSATQTVVQRSKFPLARKVLGTIRKNIEPTQVELVSDNDLRSSIRAHKFMLVALSPIFLYSLFCVAKGIVAVAQYEIITTWLLFGTPALVFSGSQLIISAISKRNFENRFQQQNKLAARRPGIQLVTP